MRKQTAVCSCSLNCVLAVRRQCPQSHLTFFSPLTSHMLTDKERWWKRPEVTTFFCTPGSTWDAISSDSAGFCWGLQASWWDWLVNGSWSLSILRRIWASADSSFCTVPMAGSRFRRERSQEIWELHHESCSALLESFISAAQPVWTASPTTCGWTIRGKTQHKFGIMFLCPS